MSGRAGQDIHDGVMTGTTSREGLTTLQPQDSRSGRIRKS